MNTAATVLRIATATEEALDACLNRRIWAIRYKLRLGWCPGQHVLVRVEQRIAAFGTVISEATQDEELAFDPRYPVLVPMNWNWSASALADRPSFDNWIKDRLREAWGEHFGFRILNQSPVPEVQADRIINELNDRLQLRLGSVSGSARPRAR